MGCSGWRVIGVLCLCGACSPTHTTAGSSAGSGGEGASGGVASDRGGASAAGGRLGRAGTAADGAAPAPPAQAAITLKITPSPGEQCLHTNGQLSEPAANNAGVLEALNCDLSTGCKPDEYVVVDRTPGTVVQCSVKQGGSNYDVLLSLTVDGEAKGLPSMMFGVSGQLAPSGGMVSVTESNSVSGGGGSQSGCSVSIVPNSGVIKSGAIWASFECDDFRDPTDISDTGCRLQGQFLFEDCQH